MFRRKHITNDCIWRNYLNLFIYYCFCFRNRQSSRQLVSNQRKEERASGLAGRHWRAGQFVRKSLRSTQGSSRCKFPLKLHSWLSRSKFRSLLNRSSIKKFHSRIIQTLVQNPQGSDLLKFRSLLNCSTQGSSRRSSDPSKFRSLINVPLKGHPD